MLALVIFLILLLVLIYAFRRPPKYPPGPLQLPIIGNLLSVCWNVRKLKYHHRVWQSWSQKYGPVLGLRLGFEYLVVISGKEIMKEVASREVFDGRPDGFFYRLRNHGQKIGLVFSDGPIWIRTRRAVLRSLKNFGFGSSIMETYIKEECEALIELRLADAGKPVLVNNMFDVSVVNILWRLVAGKRYNLENKQLKDLCYIITRVFRVADMSGGVLNFLPFLRHFIPNLIGYTELLKLHNALYKFLQETIDEHKRTLDVTRARDVIDTFLIEMVQNKDSYSDEELQVICIDFLEAGMETVSNTAGYLMLYIVRDQEIQNRIRKEIDEEIGHARSPTLSDRTRMTYTEAVILEALRITSVAPVGIPHKALEDAPLGSYVIPKGTVILFALHDLHNGPHWNEPNVFRPERFLTKDGNLMQDDRLLAFGSGRRRCVGEGLARNELFLFVTSILQKFIVKLPEGDPLPSPEPINGITLSAQDFKCIFEPRCIEITNR